MKLDKSKKIIRCAYPFNGKEEEQVSNYGQALTIQKSVERKLERDGLTEAYKLEMQKAIDAGAVVRISDKEINDHGAKPQHYITHFPVVNLGSRTTKVRIVSNSAMKNTHTKLSFNDCVHEAPNAINGLLDVLLRWRSMEVTLMLDLSKAYQSIATGYKERHLRGFLWRESRGQAWKFFAYD